MTRQQFSLYTLYGFYLVSLVNLVAQVTELALADWITKPLLMPLLLAYFFLARPEPVHRLGLLVATALVFSWFGDVLLMLSGMFIPGLVAFLLAHICYILLFGKVKNVEKSQEGGAYVVFRIGFLILFGSVLIYMLYEDLGDMLLPVVAYTFVIIAMAITALLRKGRTTTKSFILVYSGALLFIMSDALLAFNKFSHPLVQADLMIMATYIAAQLLIVKGILAHSHSVLNEK